jgi:bifunctional non-homologous end joining protein LigD
MSLTAYRKRRDFRRTSEPRGKQRQTAGQGQYVVQCHAASHLHYDFRLALDGVLKSWAVPKGPSLDPGQKRLAVAVEDHPLEYAGFEGVIAEGEYGAGTVLLWDRGRWRPDGDPHEGLRQGKLEFHLEGEKLRGGWVLVRSAMRGSKAGNTWLLIKRRDAEARSAAEGDILEESPRSVTTGRDLDEIAAGASPHGKKSRAESNGRAKPARTAAKAKAKKTPVAKGENGKAEKDGAVAAMAGARRGKLPEVFRPQLATVAERPPAGDGWLHETKFDGNRIALRIDRKQIHFWSRRMQSWTARLPHLVEAASRLPVRSALLDGELVAVERNGITSFQALQNAFREKRSGQLVYYAFDLLYLDGYDLTGCTLDARKEALSHIVPAGEGQAIRYTEHTAGQGPKAFQRACRQGLEGIICKRRESRYVEGRGPDWQKAKCVKREEFLIGGYTDPAGARKHFGALLLGYYDGGKLVYAGRVGTGFDDRTLRDLAVQLKRFEEHKSPFAASPALRGRRRGVHWFTPKLVAQIEFKDWTRDGLLRQPSFQGLREDKAPREVVREDAPPPPLAAETGSPPLGVRFIHPDKVLYEGQGITKLDLAQYYSAVADWIMPHVAGRPLTLVRCPEGTRGECFFQKHAGKGSFDHLRLIPIKEAGKTANYFEADDLAGLLALVQMGALEIHVWGARADDVERPDRIVFDLDPDAAVPWPRVVESAGQLRQFFHDLGWQSFLKMTGGKGLHIVIPVVRKHPWPEVAALCKAIADAVVQADPDRYTSRSAKAARRGKIFFDYLRNNRGATSIAPYSTRSRPGAPVAVPLGWDELDGDLRPDQFNIHTVPERLASLRRDPWQEMQDVRQTISAALKRKLGYS